MKKNQSGNTLIITLIILSLLAVSGLALVTSTQSTSVIAGNVSFKAASSAAADIGINQAITTLQGISNMDTAVANLYFPTQQPVDNYGVPTTINWAAIPVTTVQNNSLQFVIDRLCTGAMPVSNVTTQCTTSPASQSSSKKIGGAQFSIPSVYYRVTARVIGPKNSTSFIQAILQK